MGDALNKSLDDLIKEQRTKSSRPAPKPKGPARAMKKSTPKSGGRRGDGRRSSGGNSAPRNVQSISITVPGRARDRRNNRPNRGPPRIVDMERRNPEIRLDKLEGDGKWGHDMYVQEERGASKNDPRAAASDGPKLFVSNLHYEVSNDDIKELFETCGELIRYGVLYDNAGRSKGTAFVIFKKRADAEAALARYNKVPLDGQEMKIELIDQAAGPLTTSRALKSGITVGGGGGGFQRGNGGPRMFANAVRGRGNVRSVVNNADRMQE